VCVFNKKDEILILLERSDIVNRMRLRRYKPYEWMCKKNDSKEAQNATDLWAISDFRRWAQENLRSFVILRIVEW
jgi:hypothetical protein